MPLLGTSVATHAHSMQPACSEASVKQRGVLPRDVSYTSCQLAGAGCIPLNLMFLRIRGPNIFAMPERSYHQGIAVLK